jgi:uncharacterized iron-regulated membrane protein
MWWKRRPKGKLGAPPRANRTPWALFAVLVPLGWLLPTIGVSVIAVLVIEGALWLWRSRFAATPPASNP